MTRKMRITIKDIARSIGMSHATVSMALKGDKRITEATRLRVEEATGKLGYKPSRLAQGLKSGKTMLIGIVSDRSSWMLGERWEGSWLSGMHDAAREAGYRLLLNLPIRGQDRTWLTTPISAKGIDEMADGMVDGVIVVGGMALSAKDLKVLEASGLPLVFAANDAPFPGHSQYLSGHAERFYRITQALLARGHQRIGVAGIAGAGLFNKIARTEIARAMGEKGLAFDARWLKELSTDHRPGMAAGWQKAYRAWTSQDPVSAILFSYGDQAQVFEEACSIDDAKLARLPLMASMGPFSTPHQRWWGKGLLWDADAVQAGRETVGLLFERMLGGEPKTKVLHWKERSLESYWKQGEKR